MVPQDFKKQINPSGTEFNRRSWVDTDNLQLYLYTGPDGAVGPEFSDGLITGEAKVITGTDDASYNVLQIDISQSLQLLRRKHLSRLKSIFQIHCTWIKFKCE